MKYYYVAEEEKQKRSVQSYLFSKGYRWLGQPCGYFVYDCDICIIINTENKLITTADNVGYCVNRGYGRIYFKRQIEFDF
jgi:hypothetical protein